jgi:hypothetical protein
MAFCATCGERNGSEATSCASCGVDLRSTAAAGAATARQPAAPERTRVAEQPLLPTPVPPNSSPQGAKRSLPVIIAAVAAVVIALAAVAFVVIHVTGGSSHPKTAASGTTSTGTSTAKAPISDQIRAQLATVSASQDAVDASLRAVSASDGSLQQLHASAKQLAGAVSTAHTRVLAILAAARTTLAGHAALADELVALPTRLADLRPAAVSQIAAGAASTRAAYKALASQVPSAGAMNVGPAFEGSLLQLATTQQAKRAQSAQLASYLRQLDSILSLSAGGRGDVSIIVTRVQRGDTLLQDGSAEMSGPISNRQQVLARISALPPPPPGAASLAGLLTTAIEASLAADQAYRDWMSNLPYDYNFNAYGDPNNSDFQRAQGDSGQASSAKAAFVDRYNPLARRSGLRTWSGSQI